jgi:hypothetical protein
MVPEIKSWHYEHISNIGKDTSAWPADFEGVMKAFLSWRAPYYHWLRLEPRSTRSPRC